MTVSVKNEAYTRFLSIEETVDGEKTYTFSDFMGSFHARKITIINDSATANLKFKFKALGTFGTLKPNETAQIQVDTKSIILSGASTPFRLWCVGN